MSPKITVVIPSFNGLHLLKKHLPQVLQAVPSATIVVIDDGSTDNTPQSIAKNYPQVTCLVNPQNIGFTASINRAVQETESDYIVLLNNDVQPLPGLLDSALPLLKQKDVLAVTFAEADSSWPEISFHHGQIQFTQGQDRSKPHYSGWASGGSCIIKRSVWDKLGGFNPIYSPGYWEDIDLGWRAWKAGYKIVWHPACKVIHQHESTFKKLNPTKIRQIKERNQLLFNLQNITEKKLKLQQLLYLPFYALTHLGYIKIVFMVLSRLSLFRRCPDKLTDSSVLQLLKVSPQI